MRRRALSLLLGGNHGPKNVANLACLFDPSDFASITPNGSDVAQQNDLSGNDRHASQGTSANQPAYSTGGSGINNKAVITYTAANNDSLLLAGSLGIARNVAGFTCVGVARTPTLGSGQRLFTVNTAGGVGRFIASITAANVLLITTRRLDADAADTKSTTATVSAATAFFFAFAVDYVNASTFLQLDATTRAQAITAWTGGGNTSDTDSNAPPILARSGANTLNGDLAEIAAYQRFLSEAEINRLRTNYFRPKWGTP